MAPALNVSNTLFINADASTQAGWCCNNHPEKYEFVNGKEYPIYIV